jgi:hypothetical protein
MASCSWMFKKSRGIASFCFSSPASIYNSTGCESVSIIWSYSLRILSSFSSLKFNDFSKIEGTFLSASLWLKSSTSWLKSSTALLSSALLEKSTASCPFIILRGVSSFSSTPFWSIYWGSPFWYMDVKVSYLILVFDFLIAAKLYYEFLDGCI